MSSKAKTVVKIIIGLILIQGVGSAVREIMFLFCERTLLSDLFISAVFTIVLVLIGLLIVKKNSIPLAVFPEKNRMGYAVAAIIVVGLTIAAPFITGDKTLFSVLVLVYSVIITPVFEELIFRGYVWSLLESKFSSRLAVYIITTLLFAVWHLGYIDSVAFRVSLKSPSADLAFIMLMKLTTGLVFGIVLGAVRYKSRNCLASIILHGAMNLFGK
jgi:membrane protease YdiL (CAAX protease family)